MCNCLYLVHFINVRISYNFSPLLLSIIFELFSYGKLTLVPTLPSNCAIQLKNLIFAVSTYVMNIKISMKSKLLFIFFAIFKLNLALESQIIIVEEDYYVPSEFISNETTSEVTTTCPGGQMICSDDETCCQMFSGGQSWSYIFKYLIVTLTWFWPLPLR